MADVLTALTTNPMIEEQLNEVDSQQSSNAEAENETPTNYEQEGEVQKEEQSETEEENVDELKEKLQKAEKNYEDQVARAKLAEIKAKEKYTKKLQAQGDETPKSQTGEEAPKSPDLTVIESAMLQEAKIPVTDWQIVQEYADFKGLSIQEAINNSVVKAELSQALEQRNSAAAASTGSVKRGSSKVSGEAVLDAARGGHLPDLNDDRAWDAMIDKRLEEKFKG